MGRARRPEEVPFQEQTDELDGSIIDLSASMFDSTCFWTTTAICQASPW